MTEPERVYQAAADDLKKAEREYDAAESRLISARRAVSAARIGTAYYQALHMMKAHA